MKQAILILGILLLSITFSSALMVMPEDPEILIGEIIEPPVSNCGDIGAEPCPYVFKDGTWPNNGHHFEKKVPSKLIVSSDKGFESFKAVITNNENSLSNHEFLKVQCGRYFWRYDVPRIMPHQSYEVKQFMNFDTSQCVISIDTEY